MRCSFRFVLRHTRFLLALVWLSALGCRPDAQATIPDRRGGRGESCEVTNDCKEPLLCFGRRCLDEDLGFEPSSKVCAIGQCLATADCCPPLSNATKAECVELKKECASTPSSCSYYERTCLCEAVCQQNLCVASASAGSECVAADDCFGAERCVNGRCVECTKAADCGPGYLCSGTRCELGCTHDEQCAALQECKDLECVDRGCKNDRECVLLLGVRDAACKAGSCGVPCKNDAACAPFDRIGSPMTCVQGLCKFAGCEDNSDCQTMELPPRNVHLCVTPEKADQLRAGEDF